MSAAGREMGLSPAVVSKRVSLLEDRLGARLFHRTTRQLTLTETGEGYFKRIVDILSLVEEADDFVSRRNTTPRGALKITAPTTFSRLVLAPVMPAFIERFPDIELDMHLTDNFVDIIRDGVDVAIRIGELADSSLVARRVGNIRRAVVASRAYVQAASAEQPMPQVPEDLKRHPCIVYTELRNLNLWDFSTPDGSGVAVRVSGPLQTNSSEIVRAAVLDGVGIAYSPTWLFQDLIDNGAVKVLMPGWQTSPLPLHLVSPPERRHAAKVRAFAEHLATSLADCAACQ